MQKKKRGALICLMVVFSIVGVIICSVDIWLEKLSQDQSAEKYMFVWMSDTQFYSGHDPEVYGAMTEWIAENADEKKIKFVFHTGDIVNHADREEEWENADAAMKKIEGVVPYSILAGNHDLLEAEDGYGAYLTYFGKGRFAGGDDIQWYGEGEAGARILETGGQRYLILALGYNPDEAVVDWANRILEKYGDIPAILTTHSYLHADGTLSTAGRKLYQEVVLKNPNVHLVLCGHNHSAEKRIARIDDDGDGITDRTVYQLLADYQETPGGGNGYMRLLTVDEGEKTLQVTTYSPVLDNYHYFSTDKYPGRDEFCIDISDWFE